MRRLLKLAGQAMIPMLFMIAGTVFAQPQPSRLLQQIDIVRLDSRLDKLIPPNAKVERIVGGRTWVEGPVWNRHKAYLLFSDIPANAVIKWQENKGASVFLKPSGYTGKTPFDGPEPGSNGLAFDQEGRLVLAQHGDRRIARLEKNGKLRTLVDRFEGRRINSPNDLVFKSNGDLFHRSTVRSAKILRRSKKRAAVPRRLSPDPLRQTHAAH